MTYQIYKYNQLWGPYDAATVRGMVQSQQVSVADLVCGEGQTMRTYLNGKFYRARPFKLQTDSNSKLFIGQRDWRRYTDGLIDEVRLYSRALGAAEVKARYDKDVATLANPETIGN